MIRFLRGMLWVCIAIGAAAGTFAADLKSPDAVRKGLRILAAEYGDMDRKLAADRYDRLPHENQEFQEESRILRDAVAREPAEFKEKVESTLQKTLTASSHVAEVSATHDKGQVKSALESLATWLRSLNELFPEGLRTEPGTLEPGRPNGILTTPSKSP